jgi:hypothetical protein
MYNNIKMYLEDYICVCLERYEQTSWWKLGYKLNALLKLYAVVLIYNDIKKEETCL